MPSCIMASQSTCAPGVESTVIWTKTCLKKANGVTFPTVVQEPKGTAMVTFYNKQLELYNYHKNKRSKCKNVQLPFFNTQNYVRIKDTYNICMNSIKIHMKPINAIQTFCKEKRGNNLPSFYLTEH